MEEIELAPTTWNLTNGLVVPIPTLPLFWMNRVLDREAKPLVVSKFNEIEKFLVKDVSKVREAGPLR